MPTKPFRDDVDSALDDALGAAHTDFTTRVGADIAALVVTGNRFSTEADSAIQRNARATLQRSALIITEICTQALTTSENESPEAVARFAETRFLEEYQKIKEVAATARPRLRGAFQAPFDFSREVRPLREALVASIAPQNAPVESKKGASNADPLTGLLHRGLFDSDLPQMLQASDQDGPLSLIVADIDRFKAVNDTHGHKKGDLVLVEVSSRLQAVVKGKGKVYRYGGEEIAILLPNHSIEEATAVAERARATLADQEIAGLKITASFGVASHSSDATDVLSLFEKADQALYRAKDLGRDLVRVYGEPDPTEAVSRQPSRKLPEAGQLTESQRQDLRSRHFQGKRINCPKDGAILRVLDITTHASIGEEIMVTCPLCGLTENLSGNE